MECATELVHVLRDLSFPPHCSPTSLQRQREKRGLHGSLPADRPPTYPHADGSFDDGSEFGSDFGDGGSVSFSDCIYVDGVVDS